MQKPKLLQLPNPHNNGEISSPDSQPLIVSAPQEVISREDLSQSELPDDTVKGLNTIVKGAKRSVSVDGEQIDIDNVVVIADVVDDNVEQAVCKDGTVINRSEFRKKKLQDDIITNIKAINKGASDSRVSLLRQDAFQIQRMMDEFEPMPNNEPRIVSLEADSKLLVVRNFPLPDGYSPDHVDIMLDVTNYPARPPIGMHLLEKRNRTILERINQVFGDHIFKDGYYGARSFPGFMWICHHYQGHKWAFNANQIHKGDNLRKFLEVFFARV